MSTYGHLAAEHQAVASLPDDERIQGIRAERWISHPAAELALEAMGDLLTYPQRNRMPCLLVHGRTGMGKTMILRKFIRTGSPPAQVSQSGVVAHRNAQVGQDPLRRLSTSIMAGKQSKIG